jgi:hypothetical protein
MKLYSSSLSRQNNQGLYELSAKKLPPLWRADVRPVTKRNPEFVQSLPMPGFLNNSVLGGWQAHVILFQMAHRQVSLFR